MIDIQPNTYETWRPDQHLVAALFFAGTADGARALLSMLAGASISVVTLTFTLTVLSLQLAASNYSPRILDEFVKDPIQKLTLSTYLGTFSYCFIVMSNVQSATETRPEYVPFVAVNALLIYMVLALVAFVVFLQHFISNMRVENILSRSRHTALQVLRSYPAAADEATEPVIPELPETAFVVHARTSGYVFSWQLDHGLSKAEELDIIIRYNVRMGQFISERGVLAYVWPRPPDGVAHRAVLKAVRECGNAYLSQVVHNGVVCAPIRMGDNDPSLGIRQLTDIAVRALSPGINDPQTAIQVKRPKKLSVSLAITVLPAIFYGFGLALST